MKKALIEAGKEILRNTIMAIIPMLLAGVNTQTGVIHFDYRVLVAVALYTILTGIDRFLHISGSEDAPKVDKDKSFGLVRI
jgi:hypothetical protein